MLLLPDSSCLPWRRGEWEREEWEARETSVRRERRACGEGEARVREFIGEASGRCASIRAGVNALCGNAATPARGLPCTLSPSLMRRVLSGLSPPSRRLASRSVPSSPGKLPGDWPPLTRRNGLLDSFINPGAARCLYDGQANAVKAISTVPDIKWLGASLWGMPLVAVFRVQPPNGPLWGRLEAPSGDALMHLWIIGYLESWNAMGKFPM